MSDDWRSRLREGRDREGRDALHDTSRAEASEDQTVGALINESVRKLVTAIVIAGGLIGVGAYFSGDEIEAPRYQVTTTPDGRIIRLNTDSGTVIVCEGERCGIVLQRGQDLDGDPPPRVAPPREEARPALPAPAQNPAPDNQAAPAPATQR
jgi:hypothetical protein